jgi:Lrp/AsnC family leucine-responsive transcriptional regulator
VSSKKRTKFSESFSQGAIFSLPFHNRAVELPIVPYKLDKFDRRILELLQSNNRITNAELAEKVLLSAPSCLRRVRNLREQGIIKRDVAVVEPAAVGQALTVIVEVFLEREKAELVDQFRKSMQNRKEVMNCYMVSGEVDFVLTVVVPNIQSYHEFTKRAFYSNQNVRQFRSMFVMEVIKSETKVWIPVEEEA